MPRIVQRRVLCPFHFDGRKAAATFDNEVHFGTIAGTLMIQFSFAEILQALPQFDAHPLLKDRSRIRFHRLAGWNQSCRRVPHAWIKK